MRFSLPTAGGKRGLAKKVTAHAALQGIRPVETRETEVGLPKPLAVCRTTVPTTVASAAGLIGEHHLLARPESRHFPANLLHNTGTLLPRKTGPKTSRKSMSVWQIPLATIRTGSSSSRGPSISRHSIFSGAPGSRQTAARIGMKEETGCFLPSLQPSPAKGSR
jgi:hypothetical protein